MKGFFHKRALILGVFTYFVFAVVNKIVPLSYFNDYTFFEIYGNFLYS